MLQSIRDPRLIYPHGSPRDGQVASTGFGAHDGDGLQEPRKDLGDVGDAPPVVRLKARPRCSSPKLDDLLTEQGILRHEPGAFAEGIVHQAGEASEELTKHGQALQRTDFLRLHSWSVRNFRGEQALDRTKLGS